MRITLRMALAGALLLAAGTSYALDPTYTGPYGNPEEPVLRPYKWLWRGAKAVVFQTKEALVRGNMNTPVLGTVEGLRGAGIGLIEFGQSAFEGATFSPAPPDGYYKETHEANEVVQEDMLLRNTRDFAVTWFMFPLLKANDYCPLEDDEKVEARLKKAEEVREARDTAEEAREKQKEAEQGFEKSRVRKAQEKYVGDRIPFSGENGRPPADNLLRRTE